MTASHQDYYDTMPQDRHQTGDIWTGLPTCGMLGRSNLSGLVITPACDLSNLKVSTITYLPIIPIQDYLCTVAMLPELKSVCESCQNVLKLDFSVEFQNNSVCPAIGNLEKVKDCLSRYNDEGASEKVKGKIVQMKAAVDVLFGISNGNCECAISSITTCFGGKFKSIVEKMIKNSYSADIHFLPSDRQQENWSGVFKPSVVLFGYPLTVPMSIFDLAQEFDGNWFEEMDRLSSSVWLAAAFKNEKPIKKVSLTHRFLADLVSRYVSLYVRIGSPDFHERVVSQCMREVVGDV